MPEKLSVRRGYWAIQEVMNRLRPLSVWLKANRPSVTTICCYGKDYDLIRRWPLAAQQHGITAVNGKMFYDGLELHRDSGPRRYGPDGN